MTLISCLDYGKGYVQCSHTPYLLKCGVLHRLFSLGFCQNLVVDKRNQLHTFLFITSRRGTDDTILNFMDNITKQNGNEVGRHQVEGQTIIINQQERRSTNGLGTAGFILALLGLIFNWVPGLGWVLWALGLIFSFVGIFRTPRGLAIAGLVISCIALIVLIILVSAIASLV